jgi:cytochrome P450
MSRVIHYDPFDYALQDDPWPTYEALREHAPLYRNEELDFWALSRHGDVARAWRDSGLYSNAQGPSVEEWSPRAYEEMSFIAMDPPRHTQMRGLVSRYFAPGQIAALEPSVRRLARTRLSPLLEQGTFDLVGDFAASIPVDVISELIGVPQADRERVQGLSKQIMYRADGVPAVSSDMRSALDELSDYYLGLVGERRRRPADDLISVVATAEITDKEAVAVLLLLSVAGNETTPRLVASAWHAAWKHPGQRAAAFAEPSRWVEETLRYDGPSQLSARHVNADVTLYGVVMPAGSRLLLLPAAANRDPRVFADPDRFDVTRDTSRALAFGTGPHFCLGAAVARLEARVMLEELAANVRTDFDIDLAAARRARNPNVRGYATLPTTVVRR